MIQLGVVQTSPWVEASSQSSRTKEMYIPKIISEWIYVYGQQPPPILLF